MPMCTLGPLRPVVLNAWCELRSPSQQVDKGQVGAAELIVEPDAEVVQCNPRRQTCPQTLKLVGPLSAKAEGSVELLVYGFHNLADARRPTPQPLGPTPLVCAPRLGGQMTCAP